MCIRDRATTDQWQAQMHVELDKVISLSVDKTYDFSVIITSTTKHQMCIRDRYNTDHVTRVDLDNDLTKAVRIKEYSAKDGFPVGRDMYIAKIEDKVWGLIYF